MPRIKEIKKVMIIGSGPIIIGQAAEFDYAGTQACRAMQAEGLEVVLVNSNPATIMTDKAMADKIYIEPLTLDVLKRIIEIEKPDSLLPNFGGQIGLTMGMQLAKEGFLEAHGVKLRGANLDTIERAEDRQRFKDTMEEIGEPIIPSKVVENIDAALSFADSIGYPVIVRPAFTLGGTGGGIAKNKEELRTISEGGLRLSPIHQILVEKCVSGWKEIEFEVIRDRAGNAITVCSMENVDPVGVHTGDSIVVAPTVTLAEKEFHMLRNAALRIVHALGVEGGCNCQFALNPNSLEYAVIEVNPRVSRSSALASKATGYPIAKVAARIAIGYTLDEIINEVTGKTFACFEPTIDYLVLKFPKWPFDKFVYADRTLGTQMKATGEIMAIGINFEHAMMKSVRSIEMGLDTLNLPRLKGLSEEEIRQGLTQTNDERIFVVFEALKRGISVQEIADITKIDPWFIHKLNNLVNLEAALASQPLDKELYMKAKKVGYLDATIAAISGQELPMTRPAVYKMVDTCAGEFAAQAPYFYSTFDEENEAAEFIANKANKKPTILVLGSGPIRIGQGIEFDYGSVHCIQALKDAGYEAVIVNNNPETVSTDFDTSDRLYFEPLTREDVISVIATEKPVGVITQFGGQTAIKLTRDLHGLGINILGTSPDSMDMAEDRKRFDDLLQRCEIPHPAGLTVFTTQEALEAANSLQYPVLLRPSYVIGGQNMIIAHNDQDVEEYMGIITSHPIENPVLLDKYMMGIEAEVDVICDGEDILIPGIMEHIERAGVHSGDSISVYPAQRLKKQTVETMVEYSKRIVKELKAVGLVNIQYVIYADQPYVIEVNTRSSRTVPYISKVTGVPMVGLATKVMLGGKLKDFGYGTGLYPKAPMVAVKVPVFSFEKLRDVDVNLGPEMKSTGEVLGLAPTFEDALLKGLIAAGYTMKKPGNLLVTLKDADKEEALGIVRQFRSLGFNIFATEGTAEYLFHHGVPAVPIKKIGEGVMDTLALIESDMVDYVISTPSKGRKPARDGVKIRRKAVEMAVPCLTSLDTAKALIKCLAMEKTIQTLDLNVL
jgi:carbamoyl-phosphate synthase large subunit